MVKEQTVVLKNFYQENNTKVNYFRKKHLSDEGIKKNNW